MTNDEQTLRKALDQAAKARTVLDSEPFQNAYNAVGAAIVEAWQNSPVRDRDGAHELRLLWKLHCDYMGHLRKAIDDGKFAAEQLKQDKTIGQRIADRLRVI